ncbi:MAG: AAA family ATPase [Thermoproteales archaeon]|nr:AAA family ATPase [Thermoproteales archaeon]
MRLKRVESIYIEEFRGIRRLKAPLKLAKINVLIGRNNVGKTALLEALYLLPTYATGRAIPLLGKTASSLISTLHSGSLVYGYAGEARLTYWIGGHEVKLVLEAGGPTRYYIDGDAVEGESSYFERLSNLLGLKDPSNVLRFAFYVPNSSSFLSELRDKIKSMAWDSIVKRGIHRKVVEELVNPAVYDEFTEMLVERDRLKLRKELGVKGIGPLYVDVADLGEGVERISVVALALEYLSPGLVLWDDVESAVHPALMERLIKWLTSREWQVVLTTHSLDTLYALLEAYPKDACVVLLSKTVDDVVKARVFSLEEVEDLVEKHLDPRKLAEVLGI